MRELYPNASLAGFDISEQAVEIARAKVPDACIYPSDVCKPDLADAAYDLILSSDVIYMAGMQSSLEGFRLICSHLRPGGWLLLHLPAYAWLYSEHDQAVGTKERYTHGHKCINS